MKGGQQGQRKEPFVSVMDEISALVMASWPPAVSNAGARVHGYSNLHNFTQLSHYKAAEQG